jgi:hypothetical protein
MTMNKKTIKAVLFYLAATLLLPMFASAQVGTPLTQTTLVTTIGPSQNVFLLASVTGISGFGPGINSPTGGTVANGNITDLYIDRELMQVVSVNVIAKTVSVIRGSGGSQASAHALGTIVIAGTPGAFFDFDPEGFCAALPNVPPGQNQVIGNPPAFTPWINQRTGAQWICSTVTNTWVPGFSGYAGYNAATPTVTTIVASATTILPSGPLFTVSGTTAVVNITTPVGCNATAVGGCFFTVIFSGVDTWTAAGNISVAGTNTTAGTTVTFVWNASTSKWDPSRII